MKKSFILNLLVVINCKGYFFEDIENYWYNQINKESKKIESELDNSYIESNESSFIQHNQLGVNLKSDNQELIISLPTEIDLNHIRSNVEENRIVIRIKKDFFNLILVIYENGYELKEVSEIRKKSNHGYSSSSSQTSQSHKMPYVIDLNKIELELSEDKKIIYVMLPENIEKKTNNEIPIRQRIKK